MSSNTRRRRSGAVWSSSACQNSNNVRPPQRQHRGSSLNQREFLLPVLSPSASTSGSHEDLNRPEQDPISGRWSLRGQQRSSRPSFSTNDSPRPRNEPTIATTVADLFWILYGYTCQFLRYLAVSSSTILRTWAIVLLVCIALFGITLGILFLRFLQTEIVPLCTPPPHLASVSSAEFLQPTSTTSAMRMDAEAVPLVEYYVHGRGNGHYARSVAIVEQLLSKGIDVRMFIGRATMWRAINDAQENQEKPQQQKQMQDIPPSIKSKEPQSDNVVNGGEHSFNKQKRGQLTVTSVASLLPSLPLLDSISLALERVLNDCEVAKTTNRYPLLVISDGDLPGMWRARFGSIPSVSISHGQIFVIGQTPSWVSKDPVLSSAWAKQRVLNGRTSKGADWLIATNFVDIPVHGGNGVVARSPIRPEVIRMGQERYLRQKSLTNMDESGNVLPQGGHSVNRQMVVENTFMEPWQKDVIHELLLGKNVSKSLQVLRAAIHAKEISPLVIHNDMNDANNLKLIRRKLVICYFRDKNGDLLTDALLRSGFDVLLFERGYHKGLSDHKDEKKLGQDLIVRQPRNKHTAVMEEETSLRDHWVHILEQHNKHLLDNKDDRKGSRINEKNNAGNVMDDVGGNTTTAKDANNDQSIYGNRPYPKTSKQETSGAPTNDMPSLQDAIRTINTLLKSNVLEEPRIIRVTDMSLFVPLLSIADGVASSAGSQLLSECIYSHLNVLALYREDDTEQMLNIEFSKHRFDDDEISNEQQKQYSNRNISTSRENVVHGMSLEKFAQIFEMISRYSTTKKAERESILLTESEEAILLRTRGLKQTYDEFKSYIASVRHSPVSWSFYHDTMHGIIMPKTSPVSTTTANNTDVSTETSVREESAAASDDDTTKKSFVDPFQGMPDAAGVIIEILEELIKDVSNSRTHSHVHSNHTNVNH